MFTDDWQGNQVAVLFQLEPERFSQIAHLCKVDGALLVDPAKQLGGSKRLFAPLLTHMGQPLQVKVKQIDFHIQG